MIVPKVEGKSCDGRGWCGPRLKGGYVLYAGVFLAI